MILAHQVYGKDEYLQVAKKGGEFVIQSQIKMPQSGWAHQYSYDMKPARARAYEPPAVCSAVTARNIVTLVDLYIYTGEERFLRPIPAALVWLERSKIGDDVWARFYEIGSNKPIYGNNDGVVRYDIEEIDAELRASYGW